MKAKIGTLFFGILIFTMGNISYSSSIPMLVGQGTNIDFNAICSSSTSIAITCLSDSHSNSIPGRILLENGDSMGIQINGQNKLVRCIDPSSTSKDSRFLNSIETVINMSVGKSLPLDKNTICNGGMTFLTCQSDPAKIRVSIESTKLFLEPTNKVKINSGSSDNQFTCDSKELAERPKSKGKRGKRIERAAAEDESYYDGGNPQ